MKYKFLLFLIIFTFINGCNSEKKNNLIETLNVRPELTGDVIIFFDSIPINWKHSKKNGSYSHIGKHELEFSKDGFIIDYFFPEYSKSKDTIIIKNITNALEIKHKYKGLDFFDYLVKPFDTLLFTYKNKTPILQRLNKIKSNKKYDYNYDSLIRVRINEDKIPSYFKFKYNSILFLENIDLKNLEDTDSIFKDKHLIRAKEDLVNEEYLLDSLYKNDFISNDIKDFYSSRIEYRKKILDIKRTKYFKYKDYKQKDSLLNYSFYRNFIYAIAEEGMLKKVNIKKSSNFSIRDPEAMYDSVQINPNLSNGTKKFLSFIWLENIMQSSSNERIEKYFDLFKSNYKNESDLVDYFIEKYKLNSTLSTDLILEGKNGYRKTLQDIIEENRGKILYIDFWASWCLPCRKIMPASHKLKEKFKNDDVVFIYLALNDDVEAWKIASVEEGLSNNNYLITNPKTSSLIDELNITSIPRYLLYDKKQKLVYKNAPAPNHSEIEKTINSLLVKE